MQVSRMASSVVAPLFEMHRRLLSLPPTWSGSSEEVLKDVLYLQNPILLKQFKKLNNLK